jgi:predicted deacylase
MTMLQPVVFEGPGPGPRLVVLGAVHGNETCGTRAIERVLRELAAGGWRIAAGHVTFVPVTNRLAYERGTRSGDRNLNRHLAPTATPVDNEDRIANELCPLLAAHDVLLDLHSFRSSGPPFVMVGPEDNQGGLQPFAQAAREEALASRLGVQRALDGWLETYATGATRRGGSAAYGMGTTEYMRAAGGCALTLECGQHEDPQAPEVAYRAIVNTLAHLRLVDAPDPPPVPSLEGLRLREVVDRSHPGDTFAQRWKSFDAVRAGQRVATRHDGGEVVAPADGYIVFPDESAAPGAEWFYFAQRHPRLSR